MRYLLIDHVRRIERGKNLRAIKNVSLSEDVFADHFVGFPVMPGALLIECAAQAGTILIEVSAGFERKALLAMVDHAKFRSIVQPGDQLIIDVAADSAAQDHVRTRVEIRVNDRLVMDASLVFALKDAKEFYTPRAKPFVENIYDFWLRNAERIGFGERE